MRMKNKQNVAWSTFRYFVLAFLLCLSVVPLRGQPDAAVLSSPSADSLIIFSYPSRIRMFKTEYADNRLSLRKLKKRLRTFRERQDTLYVQSYSGSWDDEKSNLRAAYWRANNLKGYLIDHYGLRERHFRTLNHPLAHPLWGEVVVVGLHAHVGWFNVKWNRDRYQDADRPLLGAGVSYGYLLPLGGHWAGEFTLGAGYANMKYDTYYNIDNGARIDTRTKNYWGITRMGLSIVYRFNLKK